MGTTADKASGYANEVAGNVKNNVGKIVGSDKLEIEGGAQEQGEAEVNIGKAKDAANEGADKAADEVNKNV